MERTEQSGGKETWEVLEERAGAASGGVNNRILF